MITNYEEYVNEGKVVDFIKNFFRSKENQNVVAEEFFNHIKKDIKENIDILTTLKSEDKTHLSLILSKDIKVSIILLEEDKKGLMKIDKVKKKGRVRKELEKLPIELEIDYSRAERYIKTLKNKYYRDIDKAEKALKYKIIKGLIKD